MLESEAEINAIIGRNIRFLRRCRGLSQRELGAALGVASQQVQKYESGANAVSPFKLVLLGRFFSCAVEELLHPATRRAGRSPPVFVSRQSVSLVRDFERISSVPLRDSIHALVRKVAKDGIDLNE